MLWMPFAIGGLVLAAAALLAAQLPVAEPAWALPATALAALCATGLLRARAAKILLAALAGGALGWQGIVTAGQDALAHRWPVARETEVVDFIACIDGPPQVAPGRIRFDVVPVAGAGPTRKLRLAWYRAPQFPASGERWRFTAKLKAPRGLVNPGSGDYALALLAAGVDGTGSVRSAVRLPVGECAERPRTLQARVDPWRVVLAARLQRAGGPHPSTHGLGLLQALALGFQERVPDEDWRAFALTGVSHLVAISGLHVTLFASLVLYLVRWVRGRGRLAPPAALGWGAGAAAVVAAAGYALLAGGNLPALRTVWMLGVGMAVRLLHREAGLGLAWAMALAMGWLLEPFGVTQLGFWLSFGAVGVLLWAGGAGLAMPLRQPGNAGWAVVREFLQVQGVVTLVLAPVMAATVGMPGWVSLPVNALAIPLFSLVLVPATLLATLLAGLWPAAAAVFVPALVTALDWLVQGLQRCAQLPGNAWSPAAPGLLLALVSGGLALLATLPVLGRRWRLLAGAGTLALLLWPAARVPPGQFRLTVLDVGQGSAAVVETASHVLVFDPGPAYGPDADAGGRVVVPYLRSSGWFTAPTVVVSHADADHAAGLESLLARWPSAIVWWGGDGGAAQPRRQPCRRGLRWQHDGVEFRFLHPGPRRERDDNSGSCVLLVGSGRHRALLLADIPHEVESRLVADNTPGALAADIVLVAHHGSNTASGEALRWATQVPQGGHAVVSAGYRNRWSFPKPAVRAGWQAAGRRFWVTADHGALRFRVSAHGVAVEALREAEPRWWRP